MGGTSFKLDWGGFDKMVGSATARVAQTQGAMAEVSEAMVSSTVERFETSTAPDGSKWKPSKRAEEEGGKTLDDTSALKSSVGYEASPSDVAWGSNKVYARIHQLGGETGRNKSVTIDQREYLGMSEEDIEENRSIIADHLIGALGGQG